MPAQAFGPFDVAAGLVLLVLALYGAIRGMVRLVLWFAGLASGWALGLAWCETLARRFGAAAQPSGGGPDWARLAAFAGIFLVTIVVFALLARAIARFLGAVKLRWVDRLAGAGLGLLVAILLLGAATVPLYALWPPDGGPLMRGSTLAPYAVAGGDYLKIAAPGPLRDRFSRFSRTMFGGPIARDDEPPRSN